MLLKVILISLVVATIEQRHTRGRFRGGTVPSATPSPVTPAPTTFATPATPNIISSVGTTASTLTKMETVRSDPDAMEEPVNNTTSMVAMNEDDDTVTPAVTNNNNTGGTFALDDTSGELLELEMDIPEEEEMNGTSATLLTLAAMTSQGQETSTTVRASTTTAWRKNRQHHTLKWCPRGILPAGTGRSSALTSQVIVCD